MVTVLPPDWRPFLAAQLPQAAALLLRGSLRFAVLPPAGIPSKGIGFPKDLAHLLLGSRSPTPKVNYPLAPPPKKQFLTRLPGKKALFPEGPRVERPPGDLIARAVVIARIARGEIGDVTMDDGKNSAAVALGRMGG